MKPLFLPEHFRIRYHGIDRQHLELIEILNEANAAANGAYRPEVAALFEKFHGMLDEHFRHEEEEMALVDYPHLESHKRHHTQCRKRLEQIMTDYEGSGIDKMDLSRFFDMLLQDIVKADLPFGSYLDSIGADRTEGGE